jgi:hypothetical protein
MKLRRLREGDFVDDDTVLARGGELDPVLMISTAA